MTSDRPPSLNLFSGQAGYVDLEVTARRRWAEVGQGMRSPQIDTISIGLTAGDYCAGPEWISLDELRQLRSLVDSAITIVEAIVEANHP